MKKDETDQVKDESSKMEGAFGELIPDLQKAITKLGYKTPTPIQEQCIPHVLDGRDVLGCAQTGTGKTAAFVLPLLDHLSFFKGRPDPGFPAALILAPTRELAAQIGDSIRDYSRNVKLSHTVIFGGVRQSQQVKAIDRGVDILVATPGRLLDLMQQGIINLEDLEFFILDEVDRMLDMGFIHDINKILEGVPEDRQTLFFSATMPPEMLDLANSMVKDPVRITIEPDKPAVESINQQVMFVHRKHKTPLLLDLLHESDFKKAIIFTQMKHKANRLVDNLAQAGIRSVAIHGDKTQVARTKALSDFKKGRINVLVATDVAARGLDVDDITHVFNYNLPMEPETYVHRIGRTGRAGHEGDAISFCDSEERPYLKEIEELLGKPIPADTEHRYHDDRAMQSVRKLPARAAKFKAKKMEKRRSSQQRQKGGGQRRSRSDRGDRS